MHDQHRFSASYRKPCSPSRASLLLIAIGLIGVGAQAASGKAPNRSVMRNGTSAGAADSIMGPDVDDRDGNGDRSELVAYPFGHVVRPAGGVPAYEPAPHAALPQPTYETGDSVALEPGETPQRFYVDAGATGANDGTSWQDAYTDLQDFLQGVDAQLCCATGGCEVWVAAGTYTPDRGMGIRGLSFQLVNCVSLYGGFAGGETSLDQRDWITNETILSGDIDENDIADLADGLNCFTISNVDAPAHCGMYDIDKNGEVDRDDLGTDENSYHVVTGSGTDHTAVIDGFTITAGSGEYSEGAGMIIVNGSPSVSNCLFLANYDGLRGAGVLIKGNSSPLITKSTFLANRVGYNHGGAMAIAEGADPVIDRCNFIANWSNTGGAVYIRESSALFTNCGFFGNRCTWSWGGGMYVASESNVTVINSLFSGNSSNSGGAMALSQSTVSLVNCTLINNWIGPVNSGGGIDHSGGQLTIRNSIFWGNIDNGGTDESAQLDTYTETVDVRHTCIQGCSEFCIDPERENFPDHPLLLSPYGGDLVVGTIDDYPRPHPWSPCIDAGDNTAIPLDVADLDGDGDTDERMPLDLAGHARFVDACATEDTGIADLPDYPAVVDIGAYEYQPTDVDQDGAIGLLDHAALTSCLTGVSGGLPDEDCEPIDLDCDGDVDLSDFGAFQRTFPGS